MRALLATLALSLILLAFPIRADQRSVTNSVLAQATTPIPAIPDSAATLAVPRMESCGEIQCQISAAQLTALGQATSLYRHGPLGSKAYSAVIGVENAELTITLIPDPMGAAGRAVSYVFDLSGSKLKRSFVNR